MTWIRHFPGDPERTARTYQGETVTFALTPPREAGLRHGWLHLNLPGPDPGGIWEYRPMGPDGLGGFTLSLPLNRPGLYRYRFAGTVDGPEGPMDAPESALPGRKTLPPETSRPGGKLIWDPCPYHNLLVDPPGVRGLKLYSFIPFASGPLRDWPEKLAVIRSMGFNAVHFLPFTQTGGSQSPYSVGDHARLDRSLLEDPESEGWEEMDQLVESCTGLGLRLCFDLVLNHVAADGRLAQEHPEWIVPDPKEPDGFYRAGCWHNNQWIRWEDLIKVWYDHPDPEIRNQIWSYFTAYACRWAALAEGDGGFLRLDNLHSSHPGFVEHLGAVLSARHPGVSLLAEYFDAPDILKKRVAPWRLNLILANSWEYPFVPELRNYLISLHEPGAPRHFAPLSTHDTEPPALLYGGLDSTIPRYFIGAALTGGQTGLVQGVEDGVKEKVPFIGYNRELPAGTPGLFHDAIKEINRLIDSEPLLGDLGNLTFIDGGHHAVLAALRRSGQSGQVLLLAVNLDICGSQELDLRPALKEHGLEGHPWTALINSGLLPQAGVLTLPPCGITALKLNST